MIAHNRQKALVKILSPSDSISSKLLLTILQHMLLFYLVKYLAPL